MRKNRIAWLLIIPAALILYIFENNTGTRALLFSVIMIPAVSALLLYLPRFELSAELQLPDTLSRGESGKGALILENSGRFPVYNAEAVLTIKNLFSGATHSASVNCSVHGREKIKADLRIGSEHSGKLDIRVPVIRLYDPLGLFVRKLECDASGSVMIPPEISPIDVALAETADFLQDSLSYSAQKPGYDPSETFRIREYVPGDPIRQIHWKLSEKTDKLLVRDLGLPIVEHMLILLETASFGGEPISDDTADGMLDMLFSLSSALLRAEIPHTVGWKGAFGDYQSCEINTLDELFGLLEPILSVSHSAGDDTVIRSFFSDNIQCSFAHAAVITPAPETDIELLYQGNRITALLPEDGGFKTDDPASEINTVYYSQSKLKSGETVLEL